MNERAGPAIEARNIVRRYGNVMALDRVSVEIRAGELFSLLGPSGCGKTTLLRIIAGLDNPDEGTLLIDGEDALPIPPHRRPVNMVFQSYALFPHLTVADNIAFGLWMKGVKETDVKRRTAEVAEMVQIDSLLDRKPAQLSGGQQQRVALARAVVNEPKVLLLDEPLGALDMKLRKELQVELLALQRRLGITFVFVTHDQEEALALSDRIAVFNHGKIEQVGDVETLYEYPRTRFVSCFLGTSNLIEADVKSTNGSSAEFATEFGDLHVELNGSRGKIEGKSKVTLAIRPEKVSLQTKAARDGINRVRARVGEMLYIGSETHYILQVNGARVSAEVMNTGVGAQGFELNDEVVMSFPPTALHVLDD